MRQHMVFNLFLMDTPSHLFPGTWRHPDARIVQYNDLDLWVDLAKLAERGKLDAIFLADAFGLHEEQNGSWDGLIRNAVMFPTADPNMLVSAMAAATENLGFIVTNSVLQHHPFQFARAASTLDHLTKGRFAWNIVTTASSHASRSMGLEAMTDHDERYRWAEEYIDVVYKLWEGSWEDGAVVCDYERNIYTDPAKVHKINHSGTRYSVEGPHLAEPSPQRTPVLFQAGSSPAGSAFAARHAEGIFMLSGSVEASGKRIRETRAAAVAAGRRAEDLQFVEGMSFVVGSTEEEALRKEADIEGYLSLEAEAIMRGSATGLDLLKLSPDTPLADIIEDAPGGRGTIQMVIDSVKNRVATVRDMFAFSSRQWRAVGTPEMIADRIQEYQAAGVDGINVAYTVFPSSYIDFVDHVVPELQRRGIMQKEYSPGTLREKLFPGNGPFLADRHPARRYHRAMASGPGM